MNEISTGRLSHAYLFTGSRGTGKTTCAKILAKAVNCLDPQNGSPCNQCRVCKGIDDGSILDVTEIDAASNNSVDNIRDLRDEVNFTPAAAKYRVYIIDEVHMLSSGAFNALLKTLEEPPEHVLFILATTEKHKILPTILSRCQTYDFNRITVDNIVRNLRMVASNEGITIDEESLHVIAHKADGAMRDALTIFDQTVAFCGTDVQYQDVLRNLNVLDYEYSFSLVDAFLRGDYPSALLTFDEVLTKGFNALHFVAALSSHLRDLIVSKSGGLNALLELPDSLKARYKEQADRCPLQFLYDSLGITTQCESGYRASVNPRLHIEFALMRLSFLTGTLAAQPAAQQVQVPAKPAAPVQPVAAPAAPVQMPVDASAGQSAPAAPAPAAQPAPASPSPVATVAPSAPSHVTPSAVEEPQRERRTRAARPGASLSLKAVMDKSNAAPAAAVQSDEQPVPSDEYLKSKWPELAQKYSDKPRLASMLSSSTLVIEEADGAKVVTFRVVNEAQKDWVESKLLYDLEGNYRKIAGSTKISLRVAVVPDDAVAEKKAYMPSEQAGVVMSENAEVKNLITDLGLDIK
jgi:DNA polymerase-3 subunit gamma/tau